MSGFAERTRSTLSATLTPLRSREFRLLFVGQSVSLLGDHVAPLAISFGVLDLTGSATDLGLVLAARTVPLVLLLLVGGVWGDRLARQRVMLASDVVRAAAQFLTAFLFATRGPIWQIAALQALYGAGEAFFEPAATALVPDTVDGVDLHRANALLGVAHNMSDVIGPAISAVLVAVTNPATAIALDAATFVVSAVSLSMLRVAAPRTGGTGRPTFAQDLVEGWHELRARTWLWVMIVYFSLLIAVAMPPVQVLGPLIAKQRLGGPGAWGLILVAGGIGALIGGLTALGLRPRRPMRTAALLSLPWALPLLLLAGPASVWLLALSRLVWGACVGLVGPIWQTTLQEQVPPAARSRVSAYDWMGSLAMMPIGLALAGPVAETVGRRPELVGAAVFVIASSLAVLAVPSVRGLRRAEAGSSA